MNEKHMYSEQIIQLYRNPINFGEMKDASAKIREANPLCGDIIDIYLKVENGNIVSAAFTGKGCAISQASASLLTENVKGKSLQEVEGMGKGEILKLLGIDIGPARIKCALLPLKAMQMCAYKHEGKNPSEVKWKT